MIKAIIQCAVVGMFPAVVSAIEPWQQVTVPSVADAARTFANPPREYAAIHWAIWGGQQSKDRILADIEHITASGGGIYMINNSRGLRPAYLSPEYMDLVKFTVDECKKRGMKVWIEGDGGYPDGFAGGLISKLHPELGMQAIVADARYSVTGGQTLDIPLPTDTLGILAIDRGAAAATPPADAGTAVPIPADGKLKWTAPSGSTWELTVKGANAEGRYSAVAGQTLSIAVPPDTTAIEARPRTGGRGAGGRGAQNPATIIPVPSGGRFQWTAPKGGNWEVTFVRHVYRSSPTRFSNRDDGTSDKDSLYSLIDYLDPAATQMYLNLVHEKYEKIVGDEFGKTVLGFRADESDYTGIIPWTPKLLETFRQQKGYDLQPYLAGFFASPMTPEARRVQADYWDVWSGMFRDNFYKPLQEWCRARDMDYMIHLNHEETMLSAAGGEGMITNEGSFWRDMRYMGVPGVDNLNQIGPGITADFPKLAASAAHLFGHPMVWEEEGGDTSSNGKFIADYQFARGMNYMNIRGLNAAPPAGDVKPLIDKAVATGWYMTRTQHMLAIGRPAAQVALYHPTDSYWLNDQQADTDTVRLTTELLEHQIDFDHIDHDSLASICTLEDGGLKNLSGQVYRAVIVPTSTVIEKNVLDRLRVFAASGGKVVFVGRLPNLVVDKTFLHADEGTPDLSFATIEPQAHITQRANDALPAPDVKLDAPCPPVKYIRRSFSDGDEYFFFNESAVRQTPTATIAGNGTVQVWDATTGTIHALAGEPVAAGHADVPLNLGPHEAKFLIVGPLPADAKQPWPTIAQAKILASLDGDWSIALGQQQMTGSLKSWQDLGNASFNGIALYKHSFDLQNLPAGQRVYLDLGNVGEVALVRLNGTDLDARAWQPYLWDVTDAVKAGSNALEVQVQVPPVNARGNFGGGGAASRPAGAGGAGAAGGRARGAGAASRPAGGGGFPAALPQPATEKGLLGPVRLISQ